jgi:hypothetical protein
MEAFWDGFDKEANAVAEEFKGLAHALKKVKPPTSAGPALNYANMRAAATSEKAMGGAMKAAPSLDYSQVNKIKQAPAAGTLDYSSPAMKQRMPSRNVRPELSATAQARIQNATKGHTPTTTWNEALKGS